VATLTRRDAGFLAVLGGVAVGAVLLSGKGGLSCKPPCSLHQTTAGALCLCPDPTTCTCIGAGPCPPGLNPTTGLAQCGNGYGCCP